MGPWHMATGALALGAVGTAVYDYLTGRNLVRDTFDRARFMRRNLQAWDAVCAANRNISELVVCLTTTPSRIGSLDATLVSLLAQHVRPRAIRIHVPWVSQREQRAYEVPSWLEALSCVQIVRTDDHGPATKLLPALRAFDGDQALLVVDDDQLYPSGLVAGFSEASVRTPDVAWGSSGWIVPTDLTDRPTTLLGNLLARPPVPTKGTRIRTPLRVDVLQGYSGYLVRPRFFDLERLFDYAGAPEAAFFVDDVWISGHLRAPKYVLPSTRYCFSVLRSRGLHARTSISVHNRGGGDHEQRNNTIMIRHLKQAWLAHAP